MRRRHYLGVIGSLSLGGCSWYTPAPRSTTDDFVQHVSEDEGLNGIQRVIDSTDDEIVVKLDPDGEYSGSELTLRDNVTIDGGGVQGACLVLASGSDADLVTTAEPIRKNTANCILMNLELRGNADENDRGNCLYGSFYNSRFYNCRFTSAPQRGVWLSSSSGSTDDNVFRDCRFDHNGDAFSSPRGGAFAVSIGLSREDFGSVGVTTLDRCWIGNNNGGGIRLRGNTNVISNCKFFGNTETPIYIDNGDHCRVTNCDISGSTTGTDRAVDISASADVRRPMIFDNFIWYDFQRAAISFRIDGGNIEGAVVRDNVIDSTKAATSTPNHAISAVDQSEGSYSACSAMGNTALGPYSRTPFALPPEGWTATNNVF